MTTILATPDTITTFPVALLGRDLGVAVLLPDGTQVAVFRVSGEYADSYYAVDNIDPFTGAGVISRGLVGEHHGEPTIASPLLKQIFRLRDGRCLSDESVQLRAWQVHFVGNEIRVAHPGHLPHS